MADFVERRNSVRFPLVISVQYSDRDTKPGYLAQTHDISMKGLSLITDKELYVRSSLNVRLKMVDDDRETSAKAEVTWSKRIYPNQWRIGLNFTDPDFKPISIVLKAIRAKAKYYQEKYHKASASYLVRTPLSETT